MISMKSLKIVENHCLYLFLKVCKTVSDRAAVNVGHAMAFDVLLHQRHGQHACVTAVPGLY